ncbi:MAG: GNAT family N-acetyltransferase [Armatimonadetes bacterium]|nr:GNAT family N-acetyltransferase [Armatimonadota bacterium]
MKAPQKKASSEVTIRPARKEDLDSVIALATESVVHSLSPFRDTTPQEARRFRLEDLQALRLYFGTEHLAVFVAECGTAFVGHVILTTGQMEAPTGELQGWILDLSVRPEYWSCGIGLRLTEQAEQYAREKGFKYMALGVTTANERAVQFYSRMGYQEERKRLVKRIG